MLRDENTGWQFHLCVCVKCLELRFEMLQIWLVAVSKHTLFVCTLADQMITG